MFAVETGSRENTRVFYGPTGHSYHINKVVEHDFCTDVYLRCCHYYREHCSATASVRLYDDGQENWTLGRHCHTCLVRDPNIRLVKRLRNEVLRACRESPYQNPRRILNSIALRYPLEVAAKVRVASFRYAMRRARLSQHPFVPRSIPELGAILENPMYRNITATQDFEDNIYSATVGPPGHQSVVFVSRRMLIMLRRAKIVFVDALFKATPVTPASRQIYQIVTVVRNNTVIPIVEVLMQSKSFEAYSAILEHLKIIAPNFSPEQAVMDFEHAQYLAWKGAYPDIEVTGCYVHYVRTYIKNLGILGAIGLMNELPAMRRLLRCGMAIPLLPQDLMQPGVDLLIRKTQAWFSQPGLEGVCATLLNVLEYVQGTWLNGWMSDIVCVHNRQHRTNNACESDNRLLTAEVAVRHPSVWVLIEGLRSYEQGAYTDMYAFERGHRIGSQRRFSAVLNDAAIQYFTQDLLQGNITVFTFLRRTSMRVAELIPDLMPPEILADPPMP